MNKSTNGKGNNSDRDDWETPQELWDELDNQYRFTFDCCADHNNRKTAFFTSLFETREKSDLQYFVCWMNPPFSKAYEMFKHFFKVVSRGVAIYRCDNMETKVWQEIIFKNASWILVPNKRIVYLGHNGKGARFPSAIIGFNVDLPKLLEGTILKVVK